MAEEFTAKFKVDISDLKKNITEASKQIKLANATFKAETAGMDKWSTNADGLSKKLEQLKSVLTGQKSILSSYQDQLKKQQEAYEENGKRAEQLKAKLQELANQGISKTDEEYKKYQSSLKEVLKEQQNNEKAVEELNLKVKEQEGVVSQTEAQIQKYTEAQTKLEKESTSLITTVEKQEQQLSDLKKQYIETAAAQGENSDEAQMLAKQIQDLSSELQENKTKLSNAEKAADDFDATMQDLDESSSNASEGFTVMKGALANLVADGIRRAVDALKDLVKETINVGKEFDTAMSKVQAVSGATGKEYEMLRDKAKEMGSTTAFTATEAAEAFNYMAMAGWDTGDMLEGIEGILNLAAASGSDLATTSDIVTDALTAMGYSAKDAGKLADVMAAASSNANTNVEMMGQTFQYAAPIVGALGYSMEDTAVAIGLMANAGIKGEKAGTALRSVLTRLSTDAGGAATAANELGVEITNADGSMRPLNDVIVDLRTAFSGLTESQQTAAAKTIAGQEAMSGLLAIVNAAPDDFNKLTKAVETSNGAAQDMANTMLDNLGGDMTILKSQLEGVQLAIYEKFEPALRKGVDMLSKLLDGIMWIVDHSSDFVTVIKVMGAAVGAYVAYTTALKLMQMGWTGIKAALEATKIAQLALNVAQNANPVGLVIAAVTALAVAAKKLVDVQNEQIEKTYGLNEAERALVDSINDEAKALQDANKARDEANQAIDAEAGYQQNLWDELQNIVDANGKIKKGYEDRAAVITGILSEALGTEIEIVNGQIQKYDELKQTIDEVIATKRAEALLDANKDEYTTAIQNQAKAYSEYSQAMKDAEATSKELAAAQEELRLYQEQLDNGVTEAYDAVERQAKVVETLTNKYNDQQEAVKNAESNYLNYANTIQNYEGLMAAIASGDADKLSAAMTNLSNSFMTAENATKEMLENQLSSFQENYTAMKEAVDMGMPGVTQAMVDQAAELVDRAKAELDRTPEALQETIDQLKQLGVTDGAEIPLSIAEGIRSGSYAVPQSANELQSLVTFDSLLQLANETGVKVPENITNGIADGSLKPGEAVNQMLSLVSFDDIISKAKDAGVNVPDYLMKEISNGTMKPLVALTELQNLADFTELKKKATDAGIDVPNSITNGIKNGSMKPKDAVTEMQSLITFNDLLEKADKAGIDVPDSLSTGITNGQMKPSEAIQKLNELTLAAADTTQEFESVGEDSVGGYVQGLRDKTADGDEAAKEFIQSVIDAAKTEQDSHSPSKVWRDEVGKSAGEGFALGIQDATSDANGAAKKLVNDTLNIVKKSLTSIVSATNQGGSQIKSSVSATTSSVVNTVQNGSTKIKTLMSNITSNMTSQTTTAGTKLKSQFTAIVNTIVNTLQSGQTKITNIVSKMFSGINSQTSKAGTQLKSQSQSIVNSVVDVTNSGSKKLKTLSENTASAMVKIMRSSRSDFYDAGEYMAQGVAKGFLSQEYSVKSQVNNMVNRIVASAKANMKISSPSKVWAEIGDFMAQGMGIGFVNEMKTVNKNIQKSLPTTAANNMLNKLQGNGIRGTAGNVTNSNVTNFTQNIYAPQQPSRIELYRQTKNLLALAGRGI